MEDVVYIRQSNLDSERGQEEERENGDCGPRSVCYIFRLIIIWSWLLLSAYVLPNLTFLFIGFSIYILFKIMGHLATKNFWIRLWNHQGAERRRRIDMPDSGISAPSHNSLHRFQNEDASVMVNLLELHKQNEDEDDKHKDEPPPAYTEINLIDTRHTKQEMMTNDLEPPPNYNEALKLNLHKNPYLQSTALN